MSNKNRRTQKKNNNKIIKNIIYSCCKILPSSLFFLLETLKLCLARILQHEENGGEKKNSGAKYKTEKINYL